MSFFQIYLVLLVVTQPPVVAAAAAVTCGLSGNVLPTKLRDSENTLGFWFFFPSLNLSSVLEVV